MMNFLFNSTADFEQDLQNFDATTRHTIVERVNALAQVFVHDKVAFARQARKPYRIHLSNGYDSSLYVVQAGPETRLILTVDDDPIFEQVIVTLLRLVPRSEVRRAYAAAAQTLYLHAPVY